MTMTMTTLQLLLCVCCCCCLLSIVVTPVLCASLSDTTADTLHILDVHTVDSDVYADTVYYARAGRDVALSVANAAGRYSFVVGVVNTSNVNATTAVDAVMSVLSPPAASSGGGGDGDDNDDDKKVLLVMGAHNSDVLSALQSSSAFAQAHGVCVGALTTTTSDVRTWGNGGAYFTHAPPVVEALALLRYALTHVRTRRLAYVYLSNAHVGASELQRLQAQLRDADEYAHMATLAYAGSDDTPANASDVDALLTQHTPGAVLLFGSPSVYTVSFFRALVAHPYAQQHNVTVLAPFALLLPLTRAYNELLAEAAAARAQQPPQAAATTTTTTLLAPEYIVFSTTNPLPSDTRFRAAALFATEMAAAPPTPPATARARSADSDRMRRHIRDGDDDSSGKHTLASSSTRSAAVTRTAAAAAAVGDTTPPTRAQQAVMMHGWLSGKVALYALTLYARNAPNTSVARAWLQASMYAQRRYVIGDDVFLGDYGGACAPMAVLQNASCLCNEGGRLVVLTHLVRTSTSNNDNDKTHADGGGGRASAAATAVRVDLAPASDDVFLLPVATSMCHAAGSARVVPPANQLAVNATDATVAQYLYTHELYTMQQAERARRLPQLQQQQQTRIGSGSAATPRPFATNDANSLIVDDNDDGAATVPPQQLIAVDTTLARSADAVANTTARYAVSMLTGPLSLADTLPAYDVDDDNDNTNKTTTITASRADTPRPLVVFDAAAWVATTRRARRDVVYVRPTLDQQLYVLAHYLSTRDNDTNSSSDNNNKDTMRVQAVLRAPPASSASSSATYVTRIAELLTATMRTFDLDYDDDALHVVDDGSSADDLVAALPHNVTTFVLGLRRDDVAALVQFLHTHADAEVVIAFDELAAHYDDFATAFASHATTTTSSNNNDEGSSSDHADAAMTAPDRLLFTTNLPHWRSLDNKNNNNNNNNNSDDAPAASAVLSRFLLTVTDATYHTPAAMLGYVRQRLLEAVLREVDVYNTTAVLSRLYARRDWRVDDLSFGPYVDDVVNATTNGDGDGGEVVRLSDTTTTNNNNNDNNVTRLVNYGARDMGVWSYRRVLTPSTPLRAAPMSPSMTYRPDRAHVDDDTDASSRWHKTVVTVVVVVVGVLLLLLLLWWLWRRLRQQQRDNRYAPKHATVPVTLIFTDVVSSTALWSRAPLAMSRAMSLHHSTIRALVKKYKCYEVKTIGDAFMIACQDATAAVELARDIQVRFRTMDWGTTELRRAYADMTPPSAAAADATTTTTTAMTSSSSLSVASAGAATNDADAAAAEGDLHAEESGAEWPGLRIRVGMNSGRCNVTYDTVTKGYDYYGDVVNTASRTEHLCGAGQVLMTAHTVALLPRITDNDADSSNNNSNNNNNSKSSDEKCNDTTKCDDGCNSNNDGCRTGSSSSNNSSDNTTPKSVTPDAAAPLSSSLTTATATPTTTMTMRKQRSFAKSLTSVKDALRLSLPTRPRRTTTATTTTTDAPPSASTCIYGLTSLGMQQLRGVAQPLEIFRLIVFDDDDDKDGDSSRRRAAATTTTTTTAMTAAAADATSPSTALHVLPPRAVAAATTASTSSSSTTSSDVAAATRPRATSSKKKATTAAAAVTVPSTTTTTTTAQGRAPLPPPPRQRRRPSPQTPPRLRAHEQRRRRPRRPPLQQPSQPRVLQLSDGVVSTAVPVSEVLDVYLSPLPVPERVRVLQQTCSSFYVTVAPRKRYASDTAYCQAMLEAIASRVGSVLVYRYPDQECSVDDDDDDDKATVTALTSTEAERATAKNSNNKDMCDDDDDDDDAFAVPVVTPLSAIESEAAVAATTMTTAAATTTALPLQVHNHHFDAHAHNNSVTAAAGDDDDGNNDRASAPLSRLSLAQPRSRSSSSSSTASTTLSVNPLRSARHALDWRLHRPRSRARAHTTTSSTSSSPGVALDAAGAPVTYVLGGPSMRADVAHGCFRRGNGMLFRLVDKAAGVWAFYNDTADFLMHVKLEVQSAGKVQMLGKTKLQRQSSSSLPQQGQQQQQQQAQQQQQKRRSLSLSNTSASTPKAVDVYTGDVWVPPRLTELVLRGHVLHFRCKYTAFAMRTNERVAPAVEGDAAD